MPGKVSGGGLTGSEYMGGLQSFTINISEQQLTDNVTYVTADNYANINNAVNGNYYNYKFRFKIFKTRQQGILQTCECMTDVDELLYTPMSYDISEHKEKPKKSSNNNTADDEEEEEEIEYKNASEHLAKIAGLLGKKLAFHCNDFLSTMEVTQENVTYADLISELLGWTSRVPNWMVNCHLKDDTLYVIQRTREPCRIDISKTEHTQPIIEREIERVTWGSEADNKTTVTKKIPGIEYIWKEKNKGEDEKSKFEYNKDNLLKKKEVKNDDGSRIETTYFYKKVDGANFLYLEREARFEKYGDNNPEVTETYYTSLGQGQRSASVYRDGEYLGSSTGSTSGDSSATDYITKRAWLREPKEVTEEVEMPGNPLIDTSFPIADTDTLVVVTSALMSLNRRTRETVSMEISDFEHIITFEDQVIFEGNTYHLQSNTIEKTPKIKNKQSISIVRWY